MDDQSSSSNKKMSETSSRFFAKMFSCFHAKASTTTASADHHHDQQQQQQQQQQKKLVIYVGGVGLDKESMMRYSVPWEYVSNPRFKQLLLLEKSEEELEKIRSEGGSVVIHCQVKEFESVYKSVKAEEREKSCKIKSYDDQLWAPYFNKIEKQKENSTTPEIINSTSTSTSSSSSSSINGNSSAVNTTLVA